MTLELVSIIVKIPSKVIAGYQNVENHQFQKHIGIIYSMKWFGLQQIFIKNDFGSKQLRNILHLPVKHR